jgi:multiple sugar transport system permease protein
MSWRARLRDNRNLLGFLFMLPAAAILLMFLAYPLVKGIWLGFTNSTIGRDGDFVGFAQFRSLFRDSVFWLSVFNTFYYTLVATIAKFVLGLWLAILLNERTPFQALIRSAVLLPYIVPTVLSAIAWWWMYDSQFSILSYALQHLGLIDQYIDFLGNAWNARHALIVANVWRGIPFIAICLLAGLQTISPSLHEAAALDGATSAQRFWHITLPLLTPIIAIVMTFSVLFTFTDFQLIYAITRGGPFNATHLMATLSFQRAIPGGQLGEGAAISTAMIPFLLFAVFISFYGLQRRRWQQGAKDA